MIIVISGYLLFDWNFQRRWVNHSRCAVCDTWNGRNERCNDHYISYFDRKGGSKNVDAFRTWCYVGLHNLLTHLLTSQGISITNYVVLMDYMWYLLYIYIYIYIYLIFHFIFPLHRHRLLRTFPSSSLSCSWLVSQLDLAPFLGFLWTSFSSNQLDQWQPLWQLL